MVSKANNSQKSKYGFLLLSPRFWSQEGDGAASCCQSQLNVNLQASHGFGVQSACLCSGAFCLLRGKFDFSRIIRDESCGAAWRARPNWIKCNRLLLSSLCKASWDALWQHSQFLSAPKTALLWPERRCKSSIKLSQNITEADKLLTVSLFSINLCGWKLLGLLFFITPRADGEKNLLLNVNGIKYKAISTGLVKIVCCFTRKSWLF